jgi:hypothetical protein
LTDYELLVKSENENTQLELEGTYNNLYYKTNNLINDNIENINSILFNYTKD